MGLLSNRKIILGLSGGIAAYKAPELVRRLKDAGADVQVVMTEAAKHFVSPLALEVVSEHPVADDLWQPLSLGGQPSRIAHTELARGCDLILIAPATAHTIGQIACGLADDLLTTLVMAGTAPVLLAPAMNTEMLLNPLVQSNLERLKGLSRYQILEPGKGMLACGILGPGRMPDPPDLIEAAYAAMVSKELQGMRVTVSAGPTIEDIDPVRFLSNRSTGTMGFELARAFAARGARVKLIAGPVGLRTPVGIAERTDVRSAKEMHEAVDAAWAETDLLAMTAAVADFTPIAKSQRKLKKQDGLEALPLERTVDILGHMSEKKDRERVKLLGFAAETNDVLTYAKGKLRRKNLDFLVANDVSQSGTGFGQGDNAGWLLTKEGERPLARLPKPAFANHIVDLLIPELLPT